MTEQDRRTAPRVPFVQRVQVARLADIESLLSKDLSAGGIFLIECDAAIGEKIKIEFEAAEIPEVHIRATAVVVRKTDTGCGAKFEAFEDGGAALTRLIKFLVSPDSD